MYNTVSITGPNICPIDGTTLQVVQSLFRPLFLCSRCFSYWTSENMKLETPELDRYLEYTPDMENDLG